MPLAGGAPAGEGRGIGEPPVEGVGVRGYLTEMCSGSEAGSYLRLIDFCITQL